MTNFAKARWETNGNELHLGMEFSKVDKAGRMVAGWATIDNVDTENDVVTAEASIDAFTRSRRNLREMHKKDSAVGRIVSFKEDKFRAPDGKEYRGIFVKVHVSKGAQNTWEKVLDGTLNGFSIGGNIIEFEEVMEKDGSEPLRKVTKYDLSELSLVDNPGNQYSDITNVFKFKKSADGSVTTLTGMVEEQKILNVFYCPNDEITKESPSEGLDCLACDNSMEVIGFIEDGSDRVEKVNTLITKYRGEGGASMKKAKTQGNKDGSETTEETVATGHEAGDPTEVPLQQGPTDGNEGADVNEVPAEDVEEVHDEGEEIAKKIDSLKSDISEILKNSTEATEEKIIALEKVVSETREFFETKVNEMDKRFESIDTDLKTTKSKQDALESSLKKINSSDAFQKSADVDDSAETVQKSEENTWGGHFSDPRGNGAFSVDNLFRG